MLVCPLVFKTSESGEEPFRWVRSPHVPAKSALLGTLTFIATGFFQIYHRRNRLFRFDFLHGIGYSLIEKNVLELNGIKRTTTAGDLLSRRRAEGNKQPDFAARLRISQAKGL